MSNDDIAAAVLECVGGYTNVANSSLCATRLRISLNELEQVDRNALYSINGVLGIANRGASGIEVVFGPNLVRGVYQAFRHLTGPEDLDIDHAGGETPQRPSANFQVKITPETPGAPQVQASTAHAATHTTSSTDPVEDSDTSALLEMLNDETMAVEEDLSDEEPTVDADFGPRLLVINGPNINMLGIGDSNLYGAEDFSELLELCHQSALEAGFVYCECYQSNHEGDLIDHVQDAFDLFDGIVINPGAYAHTSIALLDALTYVQIPAIEVRLTKTRDIEARRNSYVGQACIEHIEGMGSEGYRKAIFDMAEHLGIRPA